MSKRRKVHHQQENSQTVDCFAAAASVCVRATEVDFQMASILAVNRSCCSVY